MNWRKTLVAATAIAAGAITLNAGATAQDKEATPEAPARPTYSSDGTAHVPAFDLPPSNLMSKEAAAMMALRAKSDLAAPAPAQDISVARAQMEEALAPVVAMMKAQYPVNIAEKRIAGVPTRIFTPKDAPVDPDRVLINLHGGGFSLCAIACAMLESIPIAATGGFKVVSVDYRMAPEYKHPASVEDVAAVYRKLLKRYRPGQIGIYGCSAGGAITAQAAAWFATHDMPQAGAIGIFGAGAVPFGSGDSAYIAGYAEGSFPPPRERGKDPVRALMRGYFSDEDMEDPIVSSGFHRDLLAKFPPSLVITGTRAMDMSPAIYTNSQLLSAGVASTLIVADGMGHCYTYFPNTPESKDAYEVIVRFFKDNLG
tara:strand:- start:5423 stop:6532 length:1110 start_codon:yes stop_codon:yes gene_type:complete